MTEQEKLAKLQKEIGHLEEIAESLSNFLNDYAGDQDPILKVLKDNEQNTYILSGEYAKTYEKLYPTPPSAKLTPFEIRTEELRLNAHMIWELEKATQKMAFFMSENKVTASYQSSYGNLLALLIDKQQRATELRHAIDTQF